VAVAAEEIRTLVRELRAEVRLVAGFPAPDVLFRDLGPLYRRPRLLARLAAAVAAAHPDTDAVLAVEARGFLLGTAVAAAADRPLVLARKAGKLPPPVRSVGYGLEYGTDVLEVQPAGLPPGTRTLVVDDVLATGGTLAAAAQLVEGCGAEVAGLAVLIELAELGGRARLAGWPVFALDREAAPDPGLAAARERW
jgi:adenine phosphoribosyltransferase